MITRQDVQASLDAYADGNEETIRGLTESLATAASVHSADQAEIARLREQLESSTSIWRELDAIDLTKSDGWTLRNETQANDNSRNLPQNAIFDSGGLTVVGKRQTVGSGSSVRPFTTADVLGRHVELPNYFRTETIGTIPFGQGIWPCLLWCRPLNGEDGEIDNMEVFGDSPRIKATLHNEYGENHRTMGSTLSWDRLPTPSATAEHTYVIEKTPGRMLMTVDGVTLMDLGPKTDMSIPSGFDWDRIFETEARTWYPRITLQLGCGTSNPGCAAKQPPEGFRECRMLVRSLRAWALR